MINEHMTPSNNCRAEPPYHVSLEQKVRRTLEKAFL
jgi:hypothetical protein